MELVEEIEETDRCVDCGTEISDLERTYAVSDDSIICFRCAVRRGGAYEELHDRWVTAPQVDDLLERERPS